MNLNRMKPVYTDPLVKFTRKNHALIKVSRDKSCDFNNDFNNLSPW